MKEGQEELQEEDALKYTEYFLPSRGKSREGKRVYLGEGSHHRNRNRHGRIVGRKEPAECIIRARNQWQAQSTTKD